MNSYPLWCLISVYAGTFTSRVLSGQVDDLGCEARPGPPYPCFDVALGALWGKLPSRENIFRSYRLLGSSYCGILLLSTQR